MMIKSDKSVEGRRVDQCDKERSSEWAVFELSCMS